MFDESKYRCFDENFSLEGKTAIVTGASNGIGEAIAQMFIRKGADLAGFDMNPSPVLADYAKEHGVSYLEIIGDITVTEDIKRTVSAVMERFGKIDILVNCAGIGILETLEEYTEKVWDKTLAVNLTGGTRMALAVGAIMKENGGGSIINIASQAGIVALERHLAYGTAKAGVIQMTKQLTLEWAQYGIRVNAISPAVIMTDMGRMNWENEKGEAFKKLIPARRFGYPEEVAAACVFLASDASQLINGANLVLDGGFTIS